MTKHTKEPWSYTVEENGDDVNIKGPNDEWVIAGCGCCGSPFTASVANPRRIVECVNALEGMNPAAVREVVEAATALASDVQGLVDCADNCGEWGSECPMQDMAKPDSTIDRLQGFYDALAKLREVQE